MNRIVSVSAFGYDRRPVRIALFSFGSRGDSEPLAALALALRRAGHEAVLVTRCEEHLRLGFEAHHWDDAFPLRLGGGPAQRMQSRLRRNLLLHFPVAAWLVGWLAVHLLSVPLLLLRPSGLRSLRHKGLDGMPSLVDRVMLADLVLRPQWSLETPRGATAVARWLGPLLARYPVPGQLLSFIEARLAGADLAAIAEGADDPARERLLLWLAARRGVRCIRVPAFPRERPFGIGHPHWMAMSSFPVLLRPLSPGGPLRDWLSHALAAALGGVVRAYSFAYGLWFRLLDRGLLRSPSPLDALNAWLAGRGEPAVDWPALMRPDYAGRMRAWVGAPVLPDAPGGFWSLDPPQGWTPPVDLADFVAGAEPVIWVSRIARSLGFQEALAAALERLPGCRFVVNLPVAEARSGLDSQPRVRFVESVPHAWLFGAVSAAVHHGGAGTTAAALRAGLPSMVFPSWGDQTLWAQRVCALGAGPRPIHVRWVEPVGLERALRALLEDRGFRERANAVGRELRAAPGPEAAVAELERLLGGSGAQLQ